MGVIVGSTFGSHVLGEPPVIIFTHQNQHFFTLKTQHFYAPKLVSLLLGGNRIQSVPDSFLGNFPKLRVLDLRNGKFDRLPEEVGNLMNLVCLDLSYCMDLKILPDTVRKLQKLKCLIVINCWMLKYLPSGLVKLTSLQILDAEGSDTWAQHAPSNIARTESLDRVYPN
jgi:Leucine-rich repeat (LRR) protein